MDLFQTSPLYTTIYLVMYVIWSSGYSDLTNFNVQNNHVHYVFYFDSGLGGYVPCAEYESPNREKVCFLLIS